MKGFYFLVEEPSIKPVIECVVTNLLNLSAEDWFEIKIHQGKQDLKKALRDVIPTLSKIPNVRIMILHDQDNSDCNELKDELLQELSNKCNCPFKVRIVCRELESWFLGDMKALAKAYPGFNAENYENKAKFRSVDKIKNPSKELLSIISEYSGLLNLPKVKNAETVAPYLSLENNSISFKHFIDGIRELLHA